MLDRADYLIARVTSVQDVSTGALFYSHVELSLHKYFGCLALSHDR